MSKRKLINDTLVAIRNHNAAVAQVNMKMLYHRGNSEIVFALNHLIANQPSIPGYKL